MLDCFGSSEPRKDGVVVSCLCERSEAIQSYRHQATTRTPTPGLLRLCRASQRRWTTTHTWLLQPCRASQRRCIVFARRKDSACFYSDSERSEEIAMFMSEANEQAIGVCGEAIYVFHRLCERSEAIQSYRQQTTT